MAAPNAIERARASLRQQQRENAPTDTLLTDGQRIFVFGMFAAGFTFFVIGLLVPPRGALFWIACLIAPALMGCLGGVLAIMPGRRVDARLLGAGEAQRQVAATAAAALPGPARDALRIATVPALLAELARASPRMPASEKAAAGLVIEAATRAWNAAPDDAARLALARALPALVAGLCAGGAEAIRAADAFAADAGRVR